MRALRLAIGYNGAFLVLLLVVATLVRLDFIRAAEFAIDSDEAIVGLMANHIRAGHSLPVFYYGQHYMGALESICAAGIFSLFGSSSFTLQLTPLIFSLALIIVVRRLGQELGGVVVANTAAILCALPPAALTVWSYKARGGFIEILVIGALALLYFLRWLKVTDGALRCVYPAIVGLLLGVGWWVNNQIVYFLAPIGVFGFCHLLASWRDREIGIFKAGLVVGVGTITFIFGSAPYWVYNIVNGFPSLGMFALDKPELILAHIRGLFLTSIPILLGAKRFWEGSSYFDPLSVLYCTIYFAILVSIIVMRRESIAKLIKGQLARLDQIEILLAIVVCALAVFSISTFGWLSQAPRYLLPIYVPLFLLCGIVVDRAWRLSRSLGILIVAALVLMNLASCYWGGRALPGEPVIYGGERAARNHAEVIERLSQLGISKIRTNYWLGYRIAFESGERITFLVLQEPRQVRINSYQELPDGLSQDQVPLLLVPSERQIFIGALRFLGYKFSEEKIGPYVLVREIERPAMQLVPIERSMIASLHASSGKAENAVDGMVTTRWATGTPQRPGQRFELTFAQAQNLAAIKYRLGNWEQDAPQGLRISVIDSSGIEQTLLTDSDYQRLALFFKGSDLEVWFAPRIVTRVIFQQVGSHPILDWSIAELELYTGRVEIGEDKVRG